jgi:hypothetical protein
MIHEQSLLIESGNYRNYIRSDEERKDGFIKLPQFEPKYFRFFTNWMFMNILEDTKDVSECTLNFHELVKVYLIAEHFQIVVLKNVILYHLVNLFKVYHGWAPLSLEKEIYAGTRPGSGLRHLWVEFQIRGEAVEQGLQGYTEEHLRDIIARQNDMIRGLDIQTGRGLEINVDFFYETDARTGRRLERASFFL